ncbi:uncharacterized [Tachysurus ichikawai]
MGLLDAPAELLSLQALGSVFRSRGRKGHNVTISNMGLQSAYEVGTSCMEKSPSCLLPLSPFFWQHEVTNLVSWTYSSWITTSCTSDCLTCRGTCLTV